jgi:predicted transcriptional regulator
MSNRNRDILRLSAQIVAAHAGHNETGMNTLSAIIHRVYSTLSDLSTSDQQSKVAIYESADAHDGHAHHHHHHHVHDGFSETHDHRGVADLAMAHIHPVFGQTVFDDRLICMEDGLSMKMLKRHLLTVHGMTPDEYRAKWNLPGDYPMVASQYAKLRSSLAVQSGLGLKPQDRDFATPVKQTKSRR